MSTKSIEISEELYNSLSSLRSKNDSFDDVIKKLLEPYEEFTDEQAEFYNQEIERIENGIFENVEEITLSEIESEINQLENEIENEL